MRASAIAAAVVAVLAALAPAARAECRPAAVPHGDPQLVQSVTERLTANGIETAPAVDCPAVRVQVMQHGSQVHLRVTDAYQRLGERDVQDVATAAAIIESWTLQEIDAGAMPAEPIASIGAVRPSSRTSTGIAVALRSVVTEESSTWVGASISGCVQVGWACIGPTLHVVKDLEATGSRSTGDLHSLQIDALASAEVPLHAARFVISPGIDLGYAWQHVVGDHMDAHLMPFTITETGHALRAGAHVRITRSVARGLALFGELAADGALAQTGTSNAPSGAFGISLGARLEAR